jgi:polysaccharide biosynthesis/export protein
MVSKTSRILRGNVMAGVGFAVFLVAGLISARAQQQTTTTAVQPVGVSKETSAPATPVSATAAPADYTVSPEDVLEVYVMDVPEVTRSYRVSSSGLLTLPLLPEPIPAAGETLDQLSHVIATEFHDAGMLNNAHVTVSLVETRLHTILVSGEVRTPLAYPVFGPTRLLQVLIKAGGLTENAGNDAIVTRGEMGMRAELEDSGGTNKANSVIQGQSFTLDIRKLIEKGDDKNNILLYPGDRVTVERAELIYVMGAVMRPGGYVLSRPNQQITVLKALAMAGDVNNVAKRNRILLLRRDPTLPEGKRDEIPVDYKGMVKGRTADIRLQPDDILFVPESAGLKAMRTSMNAAVSVATYGATSLMIYH